MSTIINPNLGMGTLCFRNISETEFLSEFSASNITYCNDDKFVKDFQGNVCEYLLSVRARFIVNDIIGKHSEQDINRIACMFSEDKDNILRLVYKIRDRSSSNEYGFYTDGGAPCVKTINNMQYLSIVECIEQYLRCMYFGGLSRKSAMMFSPLIYYILKIEFEDNIIIQANNVRIEFLKQFERYLSLHGLSPNSIVSMISMLKRVLRWASEFGFAPKRDLSRYKLRKVNYRPTISLTPGEIQQICDFNPNTIEFASTKLKETYRKIRDHFVLSYYLGQGFQDMERINEHNFGNSYEFFKINQQKNGSTAIVDFKQIYGCCPDVVKEILDRYSHRAPWNGIYATFNSRLHELCRLAGLTREVKYETKIRGIILERTFKMYELITFPCARRSFEANATRRGIPSQVIKNALGRT